MSLSQETLIFLEQNPKFLSTDSPFLIGKGTERQCFLLPQHKDVLLKLSPRKSDKQTRREIDYFNFLFHKKIPFSHLPQFLGSVQTKEYNGFLQERVLNTDGTPAVTLCQYIKDLSPLQQNSKEEIQQMLAEFFRYLYWHNILPCDLQTDNLLVKITKNGKKLILVDGLGSTDFINLSQYVTWIGRKKILRKINFFLNHDHFLLTLFENKENISDWIFTQVTTPPENTNFK